jgi:two-component system, NarL family, nitrate/nitrite response regulator NarL
MSAARLLITKMTTIIRVFVALRRTMENEAFVGALRSTLRLELVYWADKNKSVSLSSLPRADVALFDLDDENFSEVCDSSLLKDCFSLMDVVLLASGFRTGAAGRAMQAGARGIVDRAAPLAEIIRTIEIVAAGGYYVFYKPQKGIEVATEKMGNLTKREREVLSQLAAGKSNRQIASTLKLSVRTVETHRHNMRSRLGIVGHSQLIKVAVESTLLA